MSAKLDKIEVGIFGDAKLNFPGIIETQKAQDIYIKTMESRIDALEQKMQDNAIKDTARMQMVDGIELWAKRAFWFTVAFITLAFAVTGKIGILELLKLL